jgi:hypothetical protein
MSVYKEVLPADVKVTTSYLNQLVDVLQENVSASVCRRRYQHFITGSAASIGVTSSLYQTVYDADFSLQTSNAIFDVTFGVRPGGNVVTSSQSGVDSNGKELFPSSSLMMREKLDIYRQFAQALLGDSSLSFASPFDSSTSSDTIDVAMFVAFKRLFARDAMKRESFAMLFYQSASATTPNLARPTTNGSAIYTDVGAATNKLTAFGGQVGNVVDASSTSRNVGLMFYDRGVMVLDVNKITSASQFMSGTIDAVTSNGRTNLGGIGTETYNTAKLVPDLIVSASMDNIIDHFCGTRFGTGSISALTFQNVTNINSTLIFCRLTADEFNYSSHPTFTDDDNRIVTIEQGAEDSQTSFTFITSVGLYDANDNLLAVAKVSRPIEKNNERDLTIRVRMDF